MHDIARKKGWRIGAVHGNAGNLAGGDTITFQRTGTVRVSRDGSDWNGVRWAGDGRTATGTLPDNRQFTVVLTNGPAERPRLDCRIKRDEKDDDGEGGGWTTQEGETPLGGPGFEYGGVKR